MAKVKVNNKTDIVGNPCMRGQDGQLKLQLKNRLNLWEDYCEELLHKKILGHVGWRWDRI